MPRSPLPRTLLAILPIFGALLAALAAHQRWPIPLSLFAMAVVASASAIIYWPAPLAKQEPVEIAKTAEQVQPSELPKLIPMLTATSPPRATTAPPKSTPAPSEAGTVGTRADALITGEPHETDLLTGLLGPEAFFARLARELDRCKVANQTAILVICDLDAFGERQLRSGSLCWVAWEHRGCEEKSASGQKISARAPGPPGHCLSPLGLSLLGAR